MHSGYAELHARSAFSFLRGASSPEALVREAARLELPAVGLCDRDGVYGAPRFFQAARETGLRAIVGAEITLFDGSVLPLLAMNRTGYQNLCRLITEAKGVERSRSDRTSARLSSPKSFLSDQSGRQAGTSVTTAAPTERKRPCFATWAEIERFAGGLVALTGDEEGPVLQAWTRAGKAAAAASLEPIVRIFGPDRVFVELQAHRTRGEERRLRLLADLAVAYNLPLLATGGVTHATRADHELADAFTCLRHHTTLEAAGRLLLPNRERHLRSAPTMQAIFADFPDALANTVRLAERLEFTLRDLGYRFPDYPVPSGETQASHLRHRVYEGAKQRYRRLTDRIRAQIEKELELIIRLGFCGYFLVVWDICRWCRDRGILVQGRGSAANSVVCYVLRITAIDPIENNLLFERFLSEGRIGTDGLPSWPDIDLDLPSGDLRESAIQELYRRYAPNGAAMTANVITYRGRSAAREMGKVLDLPEDVLDAFSSLFAGGDFQHTLEFEEQLAMAGLPAKHPRVPALSRLYRKVRGLPRHLGQHSGGMVVCAGTLDRVVPLEPASMPGRTVVQWDKDDCEELGIVKIDLLGLGMMAVLQECFELCSSGGETVGLDTIPFDDPKTYAMMQEADTIGVFQIESRAQMTTLRRFKPASFYDVAMEVSIVRPGPIVAKVARPLLMRRAEQEPKICLDPSVHEIMEPVLKRTFGVILFQEQMLQVAMVLAGFTATEAEELRRSMGFTRGTERLERIMQKLNTAMRARGHNDTVIEKVRESAYSFALYGFPEAHAMSFALLAYASTWLKAHRPAEFVTSLLNNQPMGFYGPATLVQDARRHGVVFRPVCVMRSHWRCVVEADGAVRIGFNYVKGLREAVVGDLVAAREQRPFVSLQDFLDRTHLAAAERRALASIGALNALAGHRRAALWQVEAGWAADAALFRGYGGASQGAGSRGKAVRQSSGPERSRGGVGEHSVASLARPDPASAGQTDEAGDDLQSPFPVTVSFPAPCNASPLAPMTRVERNQADFNGTGLTVGIHPLALARDRWPDVWRASDLPFARDGDRVKIGGSVIGRQRPGTAKGVVFVSLEDETGVANAIVTASMFERHRFVITQSSSLIIAGRVQNQAGVIHVKAERIMPLRDEAVPEQASHDFH